jgi:hypothetical protein
VLGCLGGSSSKELFIVSLVAQVCFTMFQRGLGGGVVEVIVLLYLVMVSILVVNIPSPIVLRGE